MQIHLKRLLGIASLAALAACGADSAAVDTATADRAASDGRVTAATSGATVPPGPQALMLLAGEAHAVGNLDGPALQARFSGSMQGAVTDRHDTLYIADTNNHSIRMLDANGNVSTFAGKSGDTGSVDGPVAEARFSGPSGITRDRAGNFYVADRFGNTIRKISRDGSGQWNVRTVAGKALTPGAADGAASEARFNGPAALALDSLGEFLYVADTSNHAIRRVRLSDGYVDTFAGKLAESGPAPAGPGVPRLQTRFDSPDGLAIDASGNVFVSDSNNFVVQVIEAGSQQAYAVAGSSGFSGSVDGPGYPGSGVARLYWPRGLALDNQGRVIVADGNTLRRIEFTPTATTVATIAGQANSYDYVDGPAAAARFQTASTLARTIAGDLVVLEYFQSTVRRLRLSTDSYVSTIAGSRSVLGNQDGVGAQARFRQPFGLGKDANSEVWVADVNGSLIRRVKADGTVTTAAGSTQGFADGTVTTARFFWPYSILRATEATSFVADAGNCAVRRITWDQVSTVTGKPGECAVIDGPLASARFRYPRYIERDSSCCIVVADYLGQVIRRINLHDGIVETIAGAPDLAGTQDGDALTAGRLFYPRQIKQVQDNEFYVVDGKGLRRIAAGPDGRLQISTVISNWTANWGPGESLAAVAISDTGTLYGAVSDHTIRYLTPNNQPIIAGTPGTQSFIPGPLPGILSAPRDLLIRSDGKIAFSTGRGIGVVNPLPAPCGPPEC